MLAVSSLWLISDSLIIKPSVLSELTQNSQILLQDPDFRYLEITQIANGLLSTHTDDANTLQAVQSYLQIKENTDIPPVVITYFFSYHQSVPMGNFFKHQDEDERSLSSTPIIEIQPDRNSFSFEFAALDYTNPSKNRFKFKSEKVIVVFFANVILN